jgi:hypothetical protein
MRRGSEISPNQAGSAGEGGLLRLQGLATQVGPKPCHCTLARSA